MYLVTTITFDKESFLSCVDWEELPLYQDLIINKYLKISKTEANEDKIGEQMMSYMQSDRHVRVPQDFIKVIDKKEIPNRDNYINDILIDLHLEGIKVDLTNNTMELDKFTKLGEGVRYLVDNYGFEILINLNKKQ
jgi:hypothetical protein